MRLLLLSLRGLAKAIFRGILYVLKSIVDKLITLTVSAAMVLGGIWLFWEMNPGFRADVNSAYQRLSMTAKDYTGIRLPYFPGLDDVIKMAGDKIKNYSNVQLPSAPNIGNMPRMPNMNDLMDLRQADTLMNRLGNMAIPKQLEPIMNMAQNPKAVDYYANLIKSGNIGKNAEAAVPLLSRQLMAGDLNVQSAAYRALYSIDTPEARRILNEYNRIIQEALKNAAPRN